MKRTFIASICLLAALAVQAEQKLKVINLAPDAPTQEQMARAERYKAEVEVASKITASDTMDFLNRLHTTVSNGHELALSGNMNAVQIRNQAIALNKLQDEGDRFGPILTPLHECKAAAIDAATSWQSLIAGNAEQVDEYHQKYLAAAKQCSFAAERRANATASLPD
ncbi:hypothetical protein HBN70_17100 [Pseudomonas lundensis]|uniref:hypothetical protein n=1 Tax=Pseudomonas lundensis TaxID=86185 RepID=UPI0014746DE7|nr:hypothetical protein [Pseudomonas lundensis]NNA22460.1 hypothetical protein [Pseudomonas lundensis]